MRRVGRYALSAAEHVDRRDGAPFRAGAIWRAEGIASVTPRVVPPWVIVAGGPPGLVANIPAHQPRAQRHRRHRVELPNRVADLLNSDAHAESVPQGFMR